MKESVNKQNYNFYFVSIFIKTTKKLILGGINEYYNN